jgi:phosphoglycerate dehydrogenase-like enzyme
MSSDGARDHVIAHHFGPHVTRLLAQRWPQFPVIEIDGKAGWRLPPETSVLLSGPAKVWADRPAQLPDGWPKALQWIQLPGAGFDVYPRWLLKHHIVTTGRGVNSVPIAEFAMANILARAKRLPDVWIRRHEDWRPIETRPAEQRQDTVDGKVLGLVGIGSIGGHIAHRALAFGMRVVALRRSRSAPMPVGVTPAASLHELLGQSDHVVLALPHTDETHHIIDRKAVASMKRGIHIVNVARGGLVDQDALLEGLESGQIGAASLDVTDPEPLPTGHPLYSHPRVRLSPHIAWNSPDTLDRLVRKFSDNLDRLIKREPMIDVFQE